jgi:flagellar biosynthesis protein FlhG
MQSTRRTAANPWHTPFAMNDQAENLRNAMAGKNVPLSLPAVAVTGGKGGIGKTSLAVNLALTLGKLGAKPLLVDFDLSLANADVLLGITPTTTLFDVLRSGADLASAAVEGPCNIGFIPAASGRDELTRLSEAQLEKLFTGLHKLSSAYDLTILDTAAGIGREVMSALRVSRMVLVVVTSDPTSITDAYALIKVLEGEAPGKDIRIVVNMCDSHGEAVETYTRVRRVVNQYLQRDVALQGIVPRDHVVAEAVRARRPFALGIDCPALQALRSMCARLKVERWK